jgi:hypothetical protein
MEPVGRRGGVSLFFYKQPYFYIVCKHPGCTKLYKVDGAGNAVGEHKLADYDAGTWLQTADGKGIFERVASSVDGDFATWNLETMECLRGNVGENLLVHQFSAVSCDKIIVLKSLNSNEIFCFSASAE